MPFIDIYRRQTKLEHVDLPKYISGSGTSRYELVYARKGGANGVVFESRRHPHEWGGYDRTCAVKLLKQQDDVRIDRFKNEIEILKNLDHPNIAAHYDSGVLSVGSAPFDVPWMAMELGGNNLRNHVSERGPLSVKETAKAALQVANALAHFHKKGYVHRDLKPANLVWEEGGTDNVLLIDFGIAKLVGADVSGRPMDDLTQHQEFVGPAFYASPELIAYADDKTTSVDQRSDYFQLGRVIWFLCTGKISAGIPSLKQCPGGDGLYEIVCELLQDDPDDRPTSLDDLCKTLEALSKPA